VETERAEVWDDGVEEVGEGEEGIRKSLMMRCVECFVCARL
jgi:hypothetical protein